MLPLILLGVGAAALLITRKSEGKLILNEPLPRVAVPPGYRIAKQREVTPTMLQAAIEHRNNPGPPGTLIEHDGFATLTQWHYHEPEGPIKPWGWHRGITVILPK